MFADDLHKPVIGKLSSSEGIHLDGSGMGHADGVGKLDLALIGKSCRNHVLGHITGRISCGTVHLGAVLTGECAAAVAGISAVGVNNDLSSSQSAVAVGSSDHETACGIDIKLRVFVHHSCRKHRIEHILLNVLMDLLLGHSIIVLGG